MVIKFKEYDIMATPEEVYKLMNLAVEEMKVEEKLKEIREEMDAQLEEVKTEATKSPAKPKQKRKRPEHYKKELDVPKMRALRNAGWTLTKIADEMRCSPQTVCRKLKEA